MNTEQIGKTIRKRKKFLKIDQKSFCEITGISNHTLSNIESGKANPTLAIIKKILDTLGMEIVVKIEGD